MFILGLLLFLLGIIFLYSALISIGIMCRDTGILPPLLLIIAIILLGSGLILLGLDSLQFLGVI
jgi:hypothetical protein